MNLLDLLFPPRCVFCGAVLGHKSCGCESVKALAPQKDDYRELPVFAGRCRSVRAVAQYRDLGRTAVLKLKFRRHPELAAGMGRMMALKAEELGTDTVTFVPMTPEKKRQRGYDQAELLAKAVSGSLKRPCKKLLEKSEGHAAQHTLGEQQRRENVRGLFSAAKPGEIRGKRILLVDDVMTTGSTLSACVQTLLAAGAKEVSCVVFAVTEYQETEGTIHRSFSER